MAYQGKNYLEIPSISVDEYKPPKYQLRAETVHVSGDTGEVTKGDAVFRYNYEQQKAYSYNNRTGQWQEVIRNKANAYSERSMILANAVFHAAYGMDFYH